MTNTAWDTIHSSERHDWRTPPELFEAIETQVLTTLGQRRDCSWNFTLDAAASDDNHLCIDYFTEKDDALSQDWYTSGWVWVNSPYGRDIGKWVDKAIEEHKKGAKIVLLAFASTDTQWFAKAWEAASATIFLTGRVNFLDHAGNKRAPAPKGSVLFVFDIDHQEEAEFRLWDPRKPYQ